MPRTKGPSKRKARSRSTKSRSVSTKRMIQSVMGLGPGVGGTLPYNATLGLNAELDYFTHNKIVSSVKRMPVEIIAPLTALQPGAPIEFLVPASGNLVRKLDESFLVVKVRIVKPNGEAVVAADKVGPVN